MRSIFVKLIVVLTSVFLLICCGKTEEEERVDKLISLLENTEYFDNFNEDSLSVINVEEGFLPASCTESYNEKFKTLIKMVKNPSCSSSDVFDAFIEFSEYSTEHDTDYDGLYWELSYNEGDYIEIFTDKDVSEIISFNFKVGKIRSYLNKIYALEGIRLYAQLKGSISGTEQNTNLSESEKQNYINQFKESLNNVESVLRYRLKDDLMKIFLNVDFKFNKESMEKEQDDEEDEYAYYIENSKWIKNNEFNFLYPSCFESPKTTEMDDMSADVITYKFQSIELCLWPLIGAWATVNENYPEKGCYVSSIQTIDTITYNSRNNIFSGYTNNGNIFYLKRLITDDDIAPHAHVLCLIYPKECQKAVEPIISQIKNWKYGNAMEDMSFNME